MTEPAIKYRLIKKEKHTGARLGEIITPTWNIPNTDVHASWDPSDRKSYVTRGTKSHGGWDHFIQHLSLMVTSW